MAKLITIVKGSRRTDGYNELEYKSIVEAFNFKVVDPSSKLGVKTTKVGLNALIVSEGVKAKVDTIILDEKKIFSKKGRFGKILDEKKAKILDEDYSDGRLVYEGLGKDKLGTNYLYRLVEGFEENYKIDLSSSRFRETKSKSGKINKRGEVLVAVFRRVKK